MSSQPPDTNHCDANHLDLEANQATITNSMTTDNNEHPSEQIYKDGIEAEKSDHTNSNEIKFNIKTTRRGHSKQYKLKVETIYKLLDRSIGVIALECGYHMVHQASLDLLNDVCCDYLTRISTLLKLSQENEGLRDKESDFVDSIERVFHQVNIPSIANLHQFICKLDAINKKCNQ